MNEHEGSGVSEENKTNYWTSCAISAVQKNRAIGNKRLGDPSGSSVLLTRIVCLDLKFDQDNYHLNQKKFFF